MTFPVAAGEAIDQIIHLYLGSQPAPLEIHREDGANGGDRNGVRDGEVRDSQGGRDRTQIELHATPWNVVGPENAVRRDTRIEVVNVTCAHRASPEIESEDGEGAAVDLTVHPDVVPHQESVIDAEVEAGSGGRLTRTDDVGDADEAVDC